MGVVIKQSFWGTFAAYLGVVIGYVNTLYFRAEYLSLEQIGLFTLITANAMLVSPISSLGAGSVFLKYFPIVDPSKRNKLFTTLFIVTIIGNLFVLSVGYFFKGVIETSYQETSSQYTDYLTITAIIIVSNSLFELFFNYSKSILKIILPTILRDIYLRIGSLFLVIGYAFSWWNFDMTLLGLGLVYFSSSIILLSFLLVKGDLKFDFKFNGISTSQIHPFLSYGIYSMLLAGSFAIVNNVSYHQIATALGAAKTGIYTTCFFIGILVEMPKRNMAKVVSPLLSQMIANKDLTAVKGLYKRSSITLACMGSLLAIGIITNISDLFNLIPKGSDFSEGYWLIVYVCLAKLLLMASSFSGEIISFSPWYRYNLYFQMLSALALIILNILLIPTMGISGVGLSYVLTILFHVFLKGIFVLLRYRVSPFGKAHLHLIFISLGVLLLGYWIQLQMHPTITIFIRSILISVVFILLIYYFKISQDINTLIDHTFEKILKLNRTK